MIPPVDGAIVRAYEATEHDYGPGHRGIDLDAQPGALVRAAASGTVVFAGPVAGHAAVTIDHGEGLRTTYSRLGDTHVTSGQRVDQGAWLGTVRDAHAGVAGLHFGVMLEGEYVDPEGFLGPLDAGSAIHLAPVAWTPPAMFGDVFGSAFEHAGDHERRCEPVTDRPPGPAPNDNIAVAVAGISSPTSPRIDAEIYEHGPEQLGYPRGRIYWFSYKGHDDQDLHEAYPATATFGDIREAAERLGELLEEIARRHPGRGIDLIAHSQGGIVARTYLQEAAAAWDPDAPRVDHIVTFASPHDGAPLASAAHDLANQPGLVGGLTHGLGRLAARSGRLPDPTGISVSQLAPGSDLLTGLAKEDVLFGVRALALAIPNDPIVPATHAGWRGQSSTTGPPSGGLVGGHKAIVSSGAALATAHRFLRDGPPLCPTKWDEWGTAAGRTFSAAEGFIPELLDTLIP